MNLSRQPGEIRVKNESKSHYYFLTLRIHQSPNLSGICGGTIMLEGDSVFCCRLLWFHPPPPYHSRGRIERKKLCMGAYVGVYYNLTLCPLQTESTQTHFPWAGIESTLSLSQGLWIWPLVYKLSLPLSGFSFSLDSQNSVGMFQYLFCMLRSIWIYIYIILLLCYWSSRLISHCIVLGKKQGYVYLYTLLMIYQHALIFLSLPS